MQKSATHAFKTLDTLVLHSSDCHIRIKLTPEDSYRRQIIKILPKEERQVSIVYCPTIWYDASS